MFVCYVCLEESQHRLSMYSCDDLIQPCFCKGTMFVHRRCLDEIRSHNENNTAFSCCMTCKQKYQYDLPIVDNKVQRKIIYYAYITRDIVGLICLVHLIMIAMILVGYMIFTQSFPPNILESLVMFWLMIFQIVGFVVVFVMFVICLFGGNGSCGNVPIVSNREPLLFFTIIGGMTIIFIMYVVIRVRAADHFLRIYFYVETKYYKIKDLYQAEIV